MVAEELLVRSGDVKIVVVEVKPDLVLVDGESLCNELDDQLSDVSLAAGTGSVLLLLQVELRHGAKVGDEKVLVFQNRVAHQDRGLRRRGTARGSTDGVVVEERQVEMRAAREVGVVEQGVCMKDVCARDVKLERERVDRVGARERDADVERAEGAVRGERRDEGGPEAWRGVEGTRARGQERGGSRQLETHRAHAEQGGDATWVHAVVDEARPEARGLRQRRQAPQRQRVADEEKDVDREVVQTHADGDRRFGRARHRRWGVRQGWRRR